MRIFGFVICRQERFDDLERQSARLFFLRHHVDDLHRWCGYEFPAIRKAVEWLWQCEKNYFRGIDEPADLSLPYQISGFREVLRGSEKVNSDE